jgi:hypothetical protein
VRLESSCHLSDPFVRQSVFPPVYCKLRLLVTPAQMTMSQLTKEPRQSSPDDCKTAVKKAFSFSVESILSDHGQRSSSPDGSSSPALSTSALSDMDEDDLSSRLSSPGLHSADHCLLASAQDYPAHAWINPAVIRNSFGPASMSTSRGLVSLSF